MELKNRSYIFRVFVGVDQLGNAVAGGNPDNTISGRTGYFANHAHSSVRWYYKLLEKIINFTFYPMDGHGHCDQAYHNDELEEYYALKGIMFFIMSLIVIGSCIILCPIFYLLLLLRVISPNVKLNQHDEI